MQRDKIRYAVAALCVALLAVACSSKNVSTKATPSPSQTATAAPAVTATAHTTPTPTVTPPASPLAVPKASPSPTPTPKVSVSPASTLSGSANVFAAASLTGAFNQMKAGFIAANPKVALTLNYNGSQILVSSIQQGAPADVFASADQANMDKLTAPGIVDPAAVKIFARNVLEIVVQDGNPKGIQTLADLAKPGMSVVLGDPSVPVGRYARQALAAAGVSVTPKSLELQVTGVTQKVALGEADAGIVYVTDVKASLAAGQRVTGVEIPSAVNVVATYPIGVVKASGNPAVAQAFVAYVVSAQGQATLASFGFRPPS